MALELPNPGISTQATYSFPTSAEYTLFTLEAIVFVEKLQIVVFTLMTLE